VTSQKARYLLLGPRFDEQQRVVSLLLVPDGSGWRLPELTDPTTYGRPDRPSTLTNQVEEVFGLETTVLMWLHDKTEAADSEQRFVAILETHGGVATAPAEWQPTSAWGAIHFQSAGEAEAVHGWLAGASRGETPALRAPWARPGWHTSASAWIDSTLAALGTRRTGPIEQRRTWSISCMLRAPATDGDFYYKAVPELFAREPGLTAALSETYPGEIPQVAAIDEVRNGMLMRAFHGPTLEASGQLGDWQGALRRYAAIQQDSVASLERWYRLGCRDRRLPLLRAQVDGLLAEREAMLAGRPGGLTEDEILTLQELAAPLQRACTLLEAYQLPYTLEHGDLHGNNIAITADGFLFYDWTDGCVTHPFFCLLPFLEFVKPEWREPLIAAYLEMWEAYLPPAALRTAFQLARPLGALHMAVSYWEIRQSTEPALRWELETGVPTFLREVLRSASLLTQTG
jgi:hypothetical protein